MDDLLQNLKSRTERLITFIKEGRPSKDHARAELEEVRRILDKVEKEMLESVVDLSEADEEIVSRVEKFWEGREKK